MVFMKQPSEITQFEELLFALEQLKSRGEIKRWGKWLEQSSFYELFKEHLSKQGFSVEGCAGKQLIRLYLNRAQKAQKRTNPVHVDEGFICAHCQKSVAPGGAQIRDHCPYCLYGRHLDRIPGDRDANCQGLMIPQYLESQGNTTWIHYSCSDCPHTFRVRAHQDDHLLEFVQKKNKGSQFK